ncbi:MAG: hypothetical protein ACHQ9S_24210 [Candidatus Binatia bacterium]
MPSNAQALAARPHDLKSYATALAETATMDAPDRYWLEIDSVKTPYVDPPAIERFNPSVDLGGGKRAWPSKRQNPALRAEVVLCCPSVPLIDSQLLNRDMQPEALFLDTVNQSAPLGTDGTVAHPDMIEIRVDLKSNLPAVA